MKQEIKQIVEHDTTNLDNFIEFVKDDLEMQNLLNTHEINSYYDLCAVIELINNPDDVVVLEVVIID